jgi:hypothetical protein
MQQTYNEILEELREFVAGRGRDDNFCYSKTYSPGGVIRCIDFSPWVKEKLLVEDTLALAVFQTKLDEGNPGKISIGVSIPFKKTRPGKVGINELSADDIANIKFVYEVKSNKEEIENVIRFPFENYFIGEVKSAKLDLLITQLLSYDESHLARILMAYNLSLNNANSYIESYNRVKKTKLDLPSDLLDTVKFNEFQCEFRKLPLATRLHLFNVLEYSRFGKKPKFRLLSKMTLYETRKVGIDENESTNILCQSKLITSFSDGTGIINPEYAEVVSEALGYAMKMAPAYRQWQMDVSDKLIDSRIRYLRNGS